MKKILSLALISMMTLSACAGSYPEAEAHGTTAHTTDDGTGSKVYFTKQITPESLVSIYEALGVSAVAAQAVHNHFKQEGRDIVYINVMNNLSVDCDCDGSPATPQLKDIGILASTDPVALDKACLDLVFSHQSVAGDDASPLIRRIENLHGTHTVEYAEQLGLGSQHYTLIDLDQTAATHGAKPLAAVRYNVYTLDGKRLLSNAPSLDSLQRGTYIVNGEKLIIE